MSNQDFIFYDLETIPRDVDGVLAEAEAAFKLDHYNLTSKTGEPNKTNKDGSTSKIWEKWNEKREAKLESWEANKDDIYHDILNGISKEHATHIAKAKVICVSLVIEGEAIVYALDGKDCETEKELMSKISEFSSKHKLPLCGFNNHNFDDLLLKMICPNLGVMIPSGIWGSVDLRKMFFGYGAKKGKLDDLLEAFQVAPDADSRNDGSIIFPKFLAGDWAPIKTKCLQDSLGLKNVHQKYTDFGGRY